VDGTLIVAIYAAVIATVGFFWQVYSWRVMRRPDVRVRVRQYETSARPPQEDWEETFPERPEDLSEQGDELKFYPELEVVVVNVGETTEVAEDVGIASVERGGIIGSVGAGAAIGGGTKRKPDKQLPPGGVIKLRFPAHRLPVKVREGGEFVGYAELVSGRRVESERDRLWDEVIAKTKKPT
jgi:hypothetical protein